MTPAVVTVTLNPAIDQTITVERLRVGSVQRALAVLHNAGGKGVNVASCLADWGLPALATGVLGAANAAPFEALFSGKGIADRFVRVPGETRTNIKIGDRSAAETTDINLPGMPADAAALQQVRAILDEAVEPGMPVVLAGSLASGLPADAYTTLCADVAKLGGRAFLDASGDALAQALAAPRSALPHCVKPNRHELEDWAGRPLVGPRDLMAAARELLARGIALVVVSMGADGALFVRPGEPALWARLPPVQAVSTVGAGDAMVAGLVAAAVDGLPLADTARLAVAFDCAKLSRVGPHLPERALVRTLAEAVEVTAVEE